MSVEKNKANVRRLNEAINNGNWSVLPELLAPNYVLHSTPEVKGPEGSKQSFISWKNAFPDYHERLDHIVAEGDMVVSIHTMTGTFKGEIAGTKPTGKKISTPVVILARCEGGKQVEAWAYMNGLDLYQQLGIPFPQA
jgi:predicted ester cyclase